MVGAVATNLHEGSRSEYLVQYIFASFGTAVPVPHQEDSGVDLYCTITERMGQLSWPRAYYAVQVKSSMGPWVLEGSESVRWLVEHPLPLFLCVVEKRLARIRLYHTSPRFYVWSMPPLPDRLELVPTTEVEGICTQWEGGNTFSLSAPVLDASVQDLLTDEFYNRARDVIRFWIDVDTANLNRVRAGLHSFRLPYKYSANGRGSGGWVTQGTNRAESLGAALASIKESVDYLAVQLFRRNDIAGATRCALLLRHLFRDDTSGATNDLALHLAINKLVGGADHYVFEGVDVINAMIDQRLTEGRAS